MDVFFIGIVKQGFCVNAGIYTVDQVIEIDVCFKQRLVLMRRQLLGQWAGKLQKAHINLLINEYMKEEVIQPK